MRPIPRPPPVTRATLPAIENRSFMLVSCCLLPAVGSDRARGLLPGTLDHEVSIEPQDKRNGHHTVSTVSGEEGAALRLRKRLTLGRRLGAHLPELPHEALERDEPLAVRDGSVAGDDPVEIERQDAVERVSPLLHRTSRFEVDAGVELVEEEVARVENTVFDKEHHHIAVGMSPTEVHGADGLAAKLDLVLVGDGLVGERASRSAGPVRAVAVAQMLERALGGNDLGSG